MTGSASSLPVLARGFGLELAQWQWGQQWEGEGDLVLLEAGRGSHDGGRGVGAVHWRSPREPVQLLATLKLDSPVLEV